MNKLDCLNYRATDIFQACGCPSQSNFAFKHFQKWNLHFKWVLCWMDILKSKPWWPILQNCKLLYNCYLKPHSQWTQFTVESKLNLCNCKYCIKNLLDCVTEDNKGSDLPIARGDEAAIVQPFCTNSFGENKKITQILAAFQTINPYSIFDCKTCITYTKMQTKQNKTK